MSTRENIRLIARAPLVICLKSTPIKFYPTITIKQTLATTQGYPKELHLIEDLYSIPESSEA